MLELTDDQVRAMERQQEGPLTLMNPRTKEVFVLIRQEVYQLTSKIIDGPNRRGWNDPADDDLIRKET